MFRKGKKALFSLIVAIICAFYLVPSAKVEAYVTFNGHKLSKGPYGTYYWISLPAVPGFETVINTDFEANMAMNRWNNTQNTKVWMKRTSTQSASIIDIQSAYDTRVPHYLAWTKFYVGKDLVGPSSSNWSWAQIVMNHASPYYGDDNPYHSPSVNYTSTVAHEIGHAFGLNHTSLQTTLMYEDLYPTTSVYGIHGPGADETKGVQALYGTLY